MASLLEYLQGRGQVFTVIPHAGAAAGSRTARLQRAALAKTVVVLADGGPAVIVIPAASTLELSLVAEAVGDPDARVATPFELERWFPDYEPGALPPLSMLLLVPMYVDPAVTERDEIVFAAGRQDVSVKMSTRDLFGSDPIVIAPLTSESRVAAST